jgi:hypothetical protein
VSLRAAFSFGTELVRGRAALFFWNSTDYRMTSIFLLELNRLPDDQHFPSGTQLITG